ncbi:hypothetical protein ABZV60_31920 [Streptomyces sp. NPDC004787]|uniref:hypothetical protein n=1 Tax=Streptomyces sp. NPDC004787 TaxID=3154291 RepID=UPI0033B84BD1
MPPVDACGLSASWNQREKSRVSALVAWFHGTSTAHKNRYHRSRSMPYERIIVADFDAV